MNVRISQAATAAIALILSITLCATAFANPGRGNGNNKNGGGEVEPTPTPTSTTYLALTFPSGTSFETEADSIDVTLVFEGVRGNGHTVNWRNDRAGSGSADFMGRDNYLASAIPLAVGSNVLSFTGIEKSGAHYATSLVVQRTDSVTIPNKPPSISGMPDGSVLAGESYVFKPNASDPDGDPLGFSITNRPAWASFNAVTGQLSGTPGATDVGSYANIEIAVSDGIDVVALPRFSIEVLAPPPVGTGMATLTWMPPTEREDGSTLTDLAGYRIKYGSSPDQLDSVVALSGPGLTAYVIDGLEKGTWYFGMTAIDSKGTESRISQLVSKTIS